MAQTVGESLLEFVQLLFSIAYYWLQAILRCILPVSWIKKDVSGQTVLITGAGSGLGRMLAFRFAQLHCRLVLWDINGEAIDQVAKEIRPKGITCRAYTVDLSKREDVYKVADKVKQELGDIDIVINNAGIVTGRKFLECPDSLIEKTMEVNVNAHFWGHIVSIASSAGLFGVAGLADYCASKFAAVGFDESLRFELEAMGKTGVHTTCVCPMFINTGMFEGVQMRFPKLLPMLEPEFVVNKIMEAILCNQAVLIIPRFNYLGYALRGILPVKVGHLIMDYLGLSHSMDRFVGRNPDNSGKKSS
ncbi:hypothetical protein BaRGS_00005794 [Batillaria attramentaria]|uniref:Epidermal retinol dehydrogenase 2 n=1 Tax=Batillaria attramentaria TaxID=370345 RepID=A0ABD0LUD1_9CAEN